MTVAGVSGSPVTQAGPLTPGATVVNPAIQAPAAVGIAVAVSPQT